MASKKIVLITGANKGLGFAIVNVAVTRYPPAHYILACRDNAAGAKAIADLKKTEGTASLELLQLDVTSDAEIRKAVEYVTSKHGKVDVLINNAGISRRPNDDSLEALRTAYMQMFEVNVTSVACMCAAFRPLLAKSLFPKVINISSGLGSMSNSLTKKMNRSAPYSTSKSALNGLTVQLQVAENDRIALRNDQDDIVGEPMIKYYAAVPGFLKTALNRFNERARDPATGANVVLELTFNEEYPGGTQWEFEGGKMQEVPW